MYAYNLHMLSKTVKVLEAAKNKGKAEQRIFAQRTVADSHRMNGGRDLFLSTVTQSKY